MIGALKSGCQTPHLARQLGFVHTLGAGPAVKALMEILMAENARKTLSVLEVANLLQVQACFSNGRHEACQ